MQTDYIIVGQGLAGTMLAYALLKKKQQILVIDDHYKTSASNVSAGIINPITGKRLILSKYFEKYHAHATKTYRELESTLNKTFYHEMDIVRIYQSAKELDQWSERKDTIASAPYIKSFNPGGLFQQWLKDPYGSLNIKGNICNVSCLLNSFAEYLLYNKQLLIESFNFADLNFREDSVTYRDITARKIIFCEGYRANNNPYFKHIPYKLAKGEILTLRIDGPELPQKLFIFGKWILPTDKNHAKVGTNFQWDDINGTPSEHGKLEILNALTDRIRFPFTITDHHAGVRPVILDLNPVVGINPTHPSIGILNGLGSKGALYAPYYAHIFAKYLVDKEPLESHINISRFNI